MCRQEKKANLFPTRATRRNPCDPAVDLKILLGIAAESWGFLPLCLPSFMYLYQPVRSP